MNLHSFSNTSSLVSGHGINRKTNQPTCRHINKHCSSHQNPLSTVLTPKKLHLHGKLPVPLTDTDDRGCTLCTAAGVKSSSNCDEGTPHQVGTGTLDTHTALQQVTNLEGKGKSEAKNNRHPWSTPQLTYRLENEWVTSGFHRSPHLRLHSWHAVCKGKVVCRACQVHNATRIIFLNGSDT